MYIFEILNISGIQICFQKFYSKYFVWANPGVHWEAEKTVKTKTSQKKERKKKIMDKKVNLKRSNSRKFHDVSNIMYDA